MRYLVTIQYALDVVADADPIRVMWRPLVGIRNYVVERPRDEVIEMIKRRNELTAGVCRSGIVGQQADYGIFLPLIGWGPEQRMGDLFIQTKPDKRVKPIDILAYEAQAAREHHMQKARTTAEETKKLN
jgi:hypothetical protein